MKVVMLTPSVSQLAGGLFDAVRGLARGLAVAEDIDVRVYGLRDAATAQDLLSWEPVPLSVFDARGPLAFGFAPGLLSALLREDADLVHVHGLWTFQSLACLRWAERTGKPYIVSPHGMLDGWAIRNSLWKKRLAGQLYQYRHLHRATALHALSGEERRAFSQFGLSRPVVTLGNGVEVMDGDNDASAPEWTKDLPADAGVLLYLGRMHPKKNLLCLLDAWDELRTDTHNWWLVLAGWDQGGYENELKRFVQDRSIQRVFFAGPQFGLEKRRTLAWAQGLILPSLSEGLPMSVLEAWTHRLPVLITPECNLPEGFAAEAAVRLGTDKGAILAGLRTFFALTPGVRSRMGQRGRELVERGYSWPGIAPRMALAYRWLNSADHTPGCVASGLLEV